MPAICRQCYKDIINVFREAYPAARLKHALTDMYPVWINADRSYRQRSSITVISPGHQKRKGTKPPIPSLTFMARLPL